MSARILIVDDEQSLVRALRQVLLLEFPDGVVDAAYSGEEALSRLAQGRYDLIIADLCMPGFDGLELIKGVRYLHPRVPIVLMTGHGSDSLRQEAASLGVDHYVDKPFDPKHLADKIHQLLSDRERSGD